jgi:hypothetical protein
MSENFTNRILMAEVQPPDFIWGRIARELDAAKEKGFVQKLAGAEIIPPVTAWENIQSRLSQSEAPVVPMRTKWVKYAVAAVTIGVIAVGAFFLFNTNKQSSGLVTTTQPDTNSVASKNDQPVSSSENGNSNNSDLATAVTPDNTNVRLPRVATKRAASNSSNVRYAAVEPVQTSNLADHVADPTQSVNENVPSGMKASIPAPEYYTIQAPNGQPVKIAARFSGAVNYLFNSDDKTDNSTWKAKLDIWRNKLMTNPSFIPTASNFLDILELREMMKDQ